MNYKDPITDYLVDLWPYNLLVELRNVPVDAPLNEDQLNGLEFAINQLPELEKTVLTMKYKDRHSLTTISKLLGISYGRLRYLVRTGLGHLRAPYYLSIIFIGLELTKQGSIIAAKEQELTARQALVVRKEMELEKEIARLDALTIEFKCKKSDFIASITDQNVEVDMKEVFKVGIEVLGLSPHSHNCLKRAHIDTLGQLMTMNRKELMMVRLVGKHALDEITSKVKSYTGYSIC